jgi:hypothetical protein
MPDFPLPFNMKDAFYGAHCNRQGHLYASQAQYLVVNDTGN